MYTFELKKLTSWVCRIRNVKGVRLDQYSENQKITLKKPSCVFDVDKKQIVLLLIKSIIYWNGSVSTAQSLFNSFLNSAVLTVEIDNILAYYIHNKM